MDYTYTSNDINIYVLECSDNKYYIGKTSLAVDIRYSQHLNDNNCAFTTKYKPIKILETIKSNDPLDEDKITKKYMIQYGIENVRGGSYTKLKLDDWMIKSLEHEFKSSQDICYKCNNKGHFAKDCDTDNFNVQKYISKFNTLDELTDEINRLELLYIEIVIIKENITNTNQFNIKSIEKIKEINKVQIIVNKLKDEIKNKYGNTDGKMRIYTNKESDDMNKLGKTIIGFEETILKIETRKDNNYINIKSMLNIYTLYFKDGKTIYTNNDMDLMIYKLIIFNLENKAKLKELVIEFKTDKNMKLILSGLYEKKIKLLES